MLHLRIDNRDKTNYTTRQYLPAPCQGATATATAGESTNGRRDDPRLAAGGFDGGMSRAAEAREAVAAKRSKVDKDERERRGLRERREAIEAARYAEGAEDGCQERSSGTVLWNGSQEQWPGKVCFRRESSCERIRPRRNKRMVYFFEEWTTTSETLAENGKMGHIAVL